jgi:small-conductance mechanosensitive channel
MKLTVIGLGQCGCRIADQFARLNYKAHAQRKATIAPSIIAVNTDQADLTGLRFIKNDYTHRVLLGLRLSVKGLLLAVIIFCLTHVLTRIGRRLLSEKVLDSRNFERGLKDSIITITTYVVWGLGLILALGVLGVNATSLAVVFGALSIGIGFGLQNIFNNFISGLILLFERPIQVGDYVEVNGVWAEVKRINVRSTIVQTFDNATVIIPNSDFISQQVTNWSFKDPRMRRFVDVGVAYGSDIELVRQTLLDIAANTPNVLNVPQPDVLFLDHGDSALIFRLRFWAHVDNYYSTTTDVRFELDRRFRELNIEIAFPQRDIHIRSSSIQQIR